MDSLNASQRKRAISDEPYARYASRPSIRYSTTYCTHNGSVYEHAPAGTRIPSPSSYSRSGYRYPLRSPRHRKTFTALSAALAVAGGATLFHWHAPNPKQVLYVDGEMPAQAMQDRLISLARGTDATEEAIRNLSIITPDMQNRPMPDLSTPAGQYALEPFLDNVRLLVLDNLSTLCRSGKENEAQSWQPIQSWLLDLRRRGISVLLVHHAGKSGDQRGTSAREDIMDTVISLRRPLNYCITDGAHFQVHITKARGIAGEEVRPFEAKLSQTDQDKLNWAVQELEDAESEQIQKLLGEGLSIRDCAEELGISKSKAHRLKQRLEHL